jgi:hypothetical protein
MNLAMTLIAFGQCARGLLEIEPQSRVHLQFATWISGSAFDEWHGVSILNANGAVEAAAGASSAIPFAPSTTAPL